MANKMHYQKGNYAAEIVGQGISQNENTKNYQFELRIKILGYMNGDGSVDPDMNQYERTIRFYFTDKGVETLEKALDNLGWNEQNPSSYSQLNLDSPNAISFVGQEIEAYCTENTYNGDTREQWGMSMGRQAYEIKPVAPAALRKLDQMFGSGLKRGSRASASKGATVQRGGTAVADNSLGITNNDLPNSMMDDLDDTPF